MPEGFPESSGVEERKVFMQSQMATWPDSNFLFAGWESCPTTGRLHYQGYVHFTRKYRKSSLKVLGGGKVSWRAAKGDFASNWAYCTKNDPQPFITGDLPVDVDAGAREQRVWDEAWGAATRGDLESIRADIRLRYYPAIRIIERDYQVAPAALDTYNNEWIWGTTGSGKSTLARLENPGAYPKNCNKWFCGYQDEDVVLVEDIDPDSAKMLARYIKIWCDKFPFMAEMKGSSRQLRPKKFVFTSQYQIEECFLDARDAAAIRRRVKVRRIHDFAEVPDTFNSDAPPGTVGTVRLDETPVEARERSFVTPMPMPRLRRSVAIGDSDPTGQSQVIPSSQPIDLVDSDDEEDTVVVDAPGERSEPCASAVAGRNWLGLNSSE